jgi:hypothetical protein
MRFYATRASIKSPGRVEAEIVPQQSLGDGLVLLATRHEWPIQNWFGLDLHGHGFVGQPFRFVPTYRGR